MTSRNHHLNTDLSEKFQNNLINKVGVSATPFLITFRVCTLASLEGLILGHEERDNGLIDSIYKRTNIPAIAINQRITD